MTIKITVLMDPTDVPKLKQAFREGRLPELGIVGIETESTGKAVIEWADKELAKHTGAVGNPCRVTCPERLLFSCE